MSELEVATPDIDYEKFLRSNLEAVFNERNERHRAKSVELLFDANATLYEPNGIVTGHRAISQTAGALLEDFGPDFHFFPEGAAMGHHGLGYLRWTGRATEGQVLISGVDIAHIKNGKITALWVLIDTSDITHR